MSFSSPNLGSLFGKRQGPAAPAAVRVHAPLGKAEALPLPDGATSAEPATAGDHYGGIQFRPDVIEEMDGPNGLSRVTFSRVLNAEIKLGDHLANNVAVARISDGAKDAVLFVNRIGASQEVVAETVKLAKKHGYRVVLGYFLVPTLVISLSQGHLDPATVKAVRDFGRDPEKNSLFNTFRSIIGYGYDNKADDVDFALNVKSEFSQVCFKISGKYIRPPNYRIATQTMRQLLGIAWQYSRGGNDGQFDHQIEQQANVELELPKSSDRPKGARLRLRWQGFAIDTGVVVTLRIQRLGESAMVSSLESGGYLAYHLRSFHRVIKSKGGLVILAGTVGSGKSTTLAQLVRMLPDTKKVVTVEDPVELELPNAYQKTVVRELLGVAQVDPALAAASRAIFRSALDALYMGEIRDPQTAALAMQVTQSGHTTFSTIHANSGLGIVDRLASKSISILREDLAAPGILKLLVYQSLVPVPCSHCSKSPAEYAQAFELTGADLKDHHDYWDRVGRLFGEGKGRYRMVDHRGCLACRRPGLPELNGYGGRTVVLEMIEPDEQMLHLILKDDRLGLHRYWRSLSDGLYESENFQGKTAFEMGVHKAMKGQIDMRDLEEEFVDLETLELQVRPVRACNEPLMKEYGT